MVHAYVSLAVALIGAVPAFLAYKQAREARQRASDAKQAAQETQGQATIHQAKVIEIFNGRVDELLRAAREAGVNEGINIERQRRAQQGGF